MSFVFSATAKGLSDNSPECLNFKFSDFPFEHFITHLFSLYEVFYFVRLMANA